MVKIISSAMIREIDKKTQHCHGIPEIILMERAGVEIFKTLQNLYSEELLQRKNILFLVGKGNNGGDALVSARTACIEGYEKIHILYCSENEGNELQVKQKNICNSLAIKSEVYNSREQLINLLENTDIIIDGLLGSGISRSVTYGNYLEIIETVSQYSEYIDIIAIDVPSGISPRTTIHDIWMPSKFTFSMGLPRIELFNSHIYPKIGTLVILNPGFPIDIVNEVPSEGYLIDIDAFLKKLPSINKTSYKNSRGHIGIFAGSIGFTGAALLCAEAAGRSRAGLVTILVDKEIYSIVASQVKSIMTFCLNEQFDTIEIQSICNRFKSIVIGPGWGKNNRKGLLKELIKKELPTVIDADAIRLIRDIFEDESQESLLHDKCVLTPHIGEFEYLIGKSLKSDPENVISILKKSAVELHCTIVLKGAITYIADFNGNFSIVIGMEPALGTGGSGDILSGIIGALIAQEKSFYDAVVLAVCLHQKIGRDTKNKLGWFIAEDLLPEISVTINNI